MSSLSVRRSPAGAEDNRCAPSPADLDQLPIEVLEAVLRILRQQRARRRSGEERVSAHEDLKSLG